jgi:cytochrome oxidase Cu insertion factor (SCO1/SenC/PrrC family)
MRKAQKNLWLVVMFILLVVLPLASYLLVKKGYSIRQNIQASQIYNPSGPKTPNFSLISHRGDTLTNSSLKDKVVIFEFIDHTSVEAISERHPLFEIQESYKGKTLNLRIVSVWVDSTKESSLQDLLHFANRYAVRENWNVVNGTGVDELMGSFTSTITNGPRDSILFPNIVLLMDKEGRIAGDYQPTNKEQFDALFIDVLYLIDK